MTCGTHGRGADKGQSERPNLDVNLAKPFVQNEKETENHSDDSQQM